MAYEELTVYAIQRPDLKPFKSRFDTFGSKKERDQAFSLLIAHRGDPAEIKDICPVELKVIVKTDSVKQMQLPGTE